MVIKTSENISIPLCVDLDGTLIKSDTIIESTLLAIKSKPIIFFLLFFWILNGKNYFKKRITNIATPNPEILTYNVEVINFIKEEQAKGRQIILTTATTQNIANSISEYLNMFDLVISSTDNFNNRSKNKSQILIDKFGFKNFDYIGNGYADLEVWKSSRNALVVSDNKSLIANAGKISEVTKIFKPTNKSKIQLLIKQLRVFQWLKNILIFIPFILAHKFGNTSVYLTSILGFLSFSFLSSFVYIVNDLLDIESDRNHHTKSKRPIASSELSIPFAFTVGLILCISSFAISIFVLKSTFTLYLLAYLILTSSYSIKLKKIFVIDILTLSILYTLRLMAGADLTYAPISKWLLAFSVFIFLSLSIIKRYTEILNAVKDRKENIMGRAYEISDINLLQSMGITSGLISVLVFILYIFSPEVIMLYGQPSFLMPVILIILYWIIRIWFLAQRGLVDEDPIIFTAKDKQSYLITFLIVLFIYLAI